VRHEDYTRRPGNPAAKDRRQQATFPSNLCPTPAAAAFNCELTRNDGRCLFVTLAIVVVDSQTRPDRRSTYRPDIMPSPSAGGQQFRLPAVFRGYIGWHRRAVVVPTCAVACRNGRRTRSYSDGVTEAMNPEQALFTEQRLLDALNADPVTSSAEVAQRLIRAVETFADGTPQSDELTLVIVRFCRVSAQCVRASTSCSSRSMFCWLCCSYRV